MNLKTLPLEQAVKTLNVPESSRNLFCSPQWLTVITRTYGTRFYVKYLEDNGQVVSYIVYSVVKNFLEWKVCISSYCDYCDGVVQSVDHWKMFFQSLRAEYPQYRIAVRNLRDQAARDSGVFHELSREYFHCLDVQGSLDEIWRNMDDSQKAAVNQAVRKGVSVKQCGYEDLKSFYDCHLHVRKDKYHLFPQPFAFFQNIWDSYMAQDNGFLLGAFNADGEFIGGNIYLMCGDTLYYKFNTSRQQFLHLRPNNVLFWEGVKLAKEKGLSYVDLGSSGYGQKGLVRFKEHMGAQRQEIVHLGYHPPRYHFSRKRILRFLTYCFTRPWMPDACVEWGSRFIYHYLA